MVVSTALEISVAGNSWEMQNCLKWGNSKVYVFFTLLSLQKYILAFSNAEVDSPSGFKEHGNGFT